MKRLLAVNVIFILIVVGCSTNRYAIGDKYLEQGNYESALNEYVRLAEAGGSLNLSQDMRALAGAMIAHYGLNQYKNSFALSKRILSLDTYNSAAIFYAGLNLEQNKKYTLAKRIYRYYEFLPEADPYYNFIRSRFDLMIEKEMTARAKMAVQMEKSVGMGQVVDNSLAVLYFVNILDDPEWGVLSKGISEMLITDFAMVKELKVIERVHLQKLMEEMGLGMSGLAEEGTSPRVGRLLRAKNIVHGSYVVKAGRNVTINSENIDITENRNFGGNEYSGELTEILDIEKQIVFSTLEAMNINVSSEVKQSIRANTTKNFQAFLEFCRGLEHYDTGNLDLALTHFQNAVKFDPDFSLAKNKLFLSSALKVVQTSNFIAKHPAIMRRKFTVLPPGVRLRPQFGNVAFTRFRLQQLSRNLDLGYLPGNDSRNGLSDVVNRGIIDQIDIRRELLAEPPRPPALPKINP